MEDAGTSFGASGIARIRDVLANADRWAVRARCGDCGHITHLDWSALVLSHSEEKSLRALARDVRCKGCGARRCGWDVVERGSAPPDVPRP
jgi:hypothetical protein